jgi:hypothetical protein
MCVKSYVHIHVYTMWESPVARFELASWFRDIAWTSDLRD